jgi:hypothetical protein
MQPLPIQERGYANLELLSSVPSSGVGDCQVRVAASLRVVGGRPYGVVAGLQILG